MQNPFRIFVVIATVIAIAFAAWFVYVVFVNPGNNGSLNRADGVSSVLSSSALSALASDAV